LVAWKGRHPWQARAGLILLTTLLVWAGYRAAEHLSARSQLRAARQALDRRDWSEARKHLKACLRTWPQSADAHRLAARAARRLEMPDEAREHLDTCQALPGGDTPATGVERALLRLQGGDLAGTETFLRDAVARDESDAVEILDVLSESLIQDYRLPEAHQCLDELLRRRPDDFDMLVRRAWTAQNQAWYGTAVESLERAVALRPGAHDTRLALAENLVTLGRYPEARDQLDSLRSKQGDNPAVLYQMARCLAGQGQKEPAVELLDRALAEEPDNAMALGERGRLSLELDRPAEAETFLRRAQPLGPPDQALLMRLADCLRLLGKDAEAGRCREEADRLRTDTQQALALTRRYREERPAGPELYHDLGCVLLRLGKDGDALRFFQKALEKDPNYRPAHESLAAFYARAGADRKAAYHRRQLD
jgi:tetratricopeptide (TPR) repeat protein